MNLFTHDLVLQVAILGTKAQTLATTESRLVDLINSLKATYADVQQQWQTTDLHIKVSETCAALSFSCLSEFGAASAIEAAFR